ncbi:NUDIX domain-containing protein [Streptomyces sp. Wh19]|uniref:NUDIX domain-containing protein n=1 Tax=Streptomyces sp. Wh19 TaxID=3076629 RepID=UPI00295881BC|nr:NUDIX domain-containing protein [Streptomyces sp. Wh19]MDV9194591.1 NUDIX domain-containing protein [Streptomyces sp. Wh19]
MKPTYRRQWLLPGGGAEPGEGPGQVFRREVHEEIGLFRTPGRVLAERTRRRNADRAGHRDLPPARGRTARIRVPRLPGSSRADDPRGRAAHAGRAAGPSVRHDRPPRRRQARRGSAAAGPVPSTHTAPQGTRLAVAP